MIKVWLQVLTSISSAKIRWCRFKCWFLPSCSMFHHSLALNIYWRKKSRALLNAVPRRDTRWGVSERFIFGCYIHSETGSDVSLCCLYLKHTLSTTPPSLQTLMVTRSRLWLLTFAYSLLYRLWKQYCLKKKSKRNKIFQVKSLLIIEYTSFWMMLHLLISSRPLIIGLNTVYGLPVPGCIFYNVWAFRWWNVSKGPLSLPGSSFRISWNVPATWGT